MATWLGRLGLGSLFLAAIGGLALRLTLEPSILAYGFEADPATAVFVAGVAVSLILLVASLIARANQRKLEQALVQQARAQDREQRRFIQRLDHELKNPLTAIQIQLDNLQEAGDDLGPNLAEVRSQADRLAQLTRGLRRLADLETRALELESFDLPELLDEVVEIVQAPDRIQLDIQRAPWPAPPIVADRELLLLALRNLVANGLAFSTEQLQIRVSHTSEYLVVDVIDTGRGIHASDLPHVTEELFRGSNVHETPGSGLGLSIVKRIVERHGGKLDIRSRLDQGTIVTLRLPYVHKVAA